MRQDSAPARAEGKPLPTPRRDQEQSLSATSTPGPAPLLPPLRVNFSFNEETLLLFGAAVMVFSAVLWTARGPNAEKTDFSVTYLVARMVLQGQGAKLYDLDEQASLRAALFQHPNPLIYEHPPFEAFFLAPLAALPYRTAYLVWGASNALIWLLLPCLLRPYAPVPREGLGYLALWFLFPPLGVALYQGQSSLALLLFYALTFVNLKRGQNFMAGVYLGLGLFKFQFIAPFALIFLLLRKWRFLGGFLLSALTLGTVSLIAVGGQGIVAYVRLLLSIGNHPANVSFGSALDMPTLEGFAYAMLRHVARSTTITVVVATLSLALIAYTAWRWHRQDEDGPTSSFDLMFGAAIAVCLMTGIHMFTHDFSPLMLALLLALAHFPSRDSPGLRFAVGTTVALFWLPLLYFALVAWHRLYLMFPLLLLFWITALWTRSAPMPGNANAS